MTRCAGRCTTHTYRCFSHSDARNRSCRLFYSLKQENDDDQNQACHERPIDEFEMAIRELAYSKWEAAGFPAGDGVDHLRQDVTAALVQKGYPHHRMLEISIDHSTVTVEGVLPTYYLRQVALECIKRVKGVTGIVDRIQVDNEIDSSASWLQRRVNSPEKKPELQIVNS